MDVRAIAPGLWTWRVPCSDGGTMGGVYAELATHVLLIDPVMPGDRAQHARFWRHLEADLARVGRPLAVLVTSRRRSRAAGEVRARSGAEVLGPEAALAVTRPVAAGADVLAGVDLLAVGPVAPGELVAHLPAWGALVAGDVLVAEGGALAWGPWTDGDPREREALAHRLRALAPRHLLTAGGDGALAGPALDAALATLAGEAGGPCAGGAAR